MGVAGSRGQGDSHIIIYVSGDVLRRLFVASPSKRGGIVVTDDYQQGVHIDVDVNNQNAGSIMWTSLGNA